MQTIVVFGFVDMKHGLRQTEEAYFKPKYSPSRGHTQHFDSISLIARLFGLGHGSFWR